ncbi:signal peptide peptidase SppA [Anaerovoracaceae bacterium SGI.195]
METISIQQKKKKNKGPVIFAAVVALTVIALILIFSLNGSRFTSGHGRKGTSDDYPPINVSGKYVGEIFVNGVISEQSESIFSDSLTYQHGRTLDAIDQMIADSNNKGLYIFVNSPGGSVSTSDELYLKIKEYKDKTRRSVVAYFDNMAASGGYYISAIADKIIANRNCWTGSIGVTIGNMYDVTGLLEKMGIKAKAITSGPNKAMGDPLSGLTEEQEEIFRGLVDEAYEQFVGIVAEGRHMDVELVKKLADGRIYTARQGMENHLIDDIMTEEEADKYVLDMIGEKGVTIQDIKFKTEKGLFKSLYDLIDEKRKSGDSLENLAREIIAGEGKFSISYLAPIDNH